MPFAPTPHATTTRWSTQCNPLQHPIRQQSDVVFATVTEARRRAGSLISACLDDERLLNFSLSHWPILESGACESSLNVAYQMLWHFECDVGLSAQGPHKTEDFYADLQFEMLKQVADYLSIGENLPEDLLMMYKSKEPAQTFRPIYYTNDRIFLKKWWKRLLTCYNEGWNTLGVQPNRLLSQRLRTWYKTWWRLPLLNCCFLNPLKKEYAMSDIFKATIRSKVEKSTPPLTEPASGLTPPNVPKACAVATSSPQPKNPFTTAPTFPHSQKQAPSR
jgi:hypothetical protein